MATRSTVPTVKQALVAALRARPGLSGVQVEYQHPGKYLEPESVWLARARGSHGIAAMRAGRKPRDEDYTIDVWVLVSQPGGDPGEAEARAYELVGEIEDALADDPKLGLDDLLWARMDAVESDAGFTDANAQALVRVTVACRARLT